LQRCTALVAHVLLAPTRDKQTVRLIDPVQSLVIHDRAFASQHDVQPAIAEPSKARCKLAKARQDNLIDHSERAVTGRAAGAVDDLAGALLADSICFERPHRGLALRGLQPFFSMSIL